MVCRRHSCYSFRYYTGTPLYPFGYGLSYTEFSLEFAPNSAPQVTAAPLQQLAAAFAATRYAVTVTNTGAVAGKETVMAFWSPPDSIDPLLKKQLFAFDGVFLQPGASSTLYFQLPDPAKIATVTEDGDRIFDRGLYTITFSKGHGAVLTAYVDVSAAAPPPPASASEALMAVAGTYVAAAAGPLVLSTFPSQFVEGHEIVVDACLEGTTDIIPHTEAFLVDYKLWSLVPRGDASHHVFVKHVASGMCLTLNATTSLVTLQSCSTATQQLWAYDGGTKQFHNAGGSSSSSSNSSGGGGGGGGCLVTGAANATMLRVNVTVSSSSGDVQCKSLGSQWELDETTGFLKSGIAGLCLAAHGVGVFNLGA